MHMSLLRKSLDLILHPTDYTDRQARLEAKYESRRIKIDKPIPLPQFRINVSQTNLQNQTHAGEPCPLVKKLPVELRLYIYRLAFGDNILHLYHFPRAVRHTCFSPDSSIGPTHCFESDYTPPVYQPPAFNFVYQKHLSTTGLPLLLTCKQIYQEGIDLLYSWNTFSLNDLNILVFWSDSPLLRRQRLVAIRSLKVSWSYYKDPAYSLGLKQAPYDWATWQRFWGIIANEMQLRSLDASIEHVGGISPEGGPILEQNWLKPMMKVSGIERVHVEVAFKSLRGEARRMSEVEEMIEGKWKRQRFLLVDH